MGNQRSTIEAEVGAVLIASSAAANASDVTARKSMDKTTKGNLQGTIKDVANIHSLFLKSGGIDIVKMFCDTDPKTTTRATVLNSIKELFNNADRKQFVLYYSGHGTKNGDWCFEGNYPTFITLHDILKLFKNRNYKLFDSSNWYDQQLVIIADCCYSGRWVKELEKLKIKNVCMQAACGANECSVDGANGGLFTSTYVNVAISYVKETNSVTIFSGFVSNMVVGLIPNGLTMIKNSAISILYNSWSKEFSPTNYGKPIATTACDGKYLLWFQFFTSWFAMNTDNDIGNTSNYLSLGTYGNV